MCNYTNTINTKTRSSEPTGEHSMLGSGKQIFSLTLSSLTLETMENFLF